MHKRLVIVGGGAGAAAAARAARLSNKFDITVVERSADLAPAVAGMPAHLGREIVDRSSLASVQADAFQARTGVSVLTEHEAMNVDVDKRQLIVRSIAGGKASETRALPFDQLLLAPRSAPRKLKVPGSNDPRIMTLGSLGDMDKMDRVIHAPGTKRIAVVGAGHIGLQVVEQLARIPGKQLLLIEAANAVMPVTDAEIGSFLHADIEKRGIQLMLSNPVVGFETTKSGVSIKLTSGGSVEVDAVVLAVGSAPETALAHGTTIELSGTGHVRVNEFQASTVEGIFAAGSCAETADLVFPERRAIAVSERSSLVQARIAAENIVSDAKKSFGGALHTTLVRCFDHSVGVTGWSEWRLREEKIPYERVIVTAASHAAYMPSSKPVTIKITYDPQTGRVFGGQVAGSEGVDKRIDVLATAITAKLNIDQISSLETSFAPHFAAELDAVNLAGSAARNAQSKLMKPVFETAPLGKTILDVRPREVAAEHPLANSVNVPLAELSQHTDKLDADKQYLAVCTTGRTAYQAARQLSLLGFDASSLSGGLSVHDKQSTAAPRDEDQDGKQQIPFTGRADVEINATDVPSPLHIIKLADAFAKLKVGQQAKIVAAEPGFSADVRAFAKGQRAVIQSLVTDKDGVTTAFLLKQGPPAPVKADKATPAPTVVKKSTSILVVSDDLEKVTSAFSMAISAATLGEQVTIYFTNWGLHAIRHPDRWGPKSPLLTFMNMWSPRGANKLLLSKFNLFGVGTFLAKKLMEEKNMPTLPLLISHAKSHKIRLVANTASMEVMGITRSELIDGIEFGGDPSFVGNATGTTMVF